MLGMKNMSEGMQAVAGPRLRRLISSVTDNRLLAVAVGVAITCMIQSSSITTVMVVGLVNSGFMTLTQSIGVIFGANIGTTITGWLLTLKLGCYGLPILGLSALVFLFARRERTRYMGMVFLGIGMLFFGLELMSEGFKPLRSNPVFVEWFHKFQADSYFGVLKCALIGCALTTIVQSSSATLGITMSLARLGIINFETAAALVLGENIGTTITAILASIGANTNARRAAMAHLFFNLLGVLWITAIFSQYMRLIRWGLHVDPSVAVLENGALVYPSVMPAIAMVHSGFNIANTILFLPFLPLLAKLVTKLVPECAIKETTHLTFLNVRMFDTPALGIEQSRREIELMAERDAKIMEHLRQALASETRDEQNEQFIFKNEELLDNVQREVTLFLSQLLSGTVPLDVADEGRRQLRIADELETVSDYITNILKMLLKLHHNHLTISEQGRNDLLNLHDLTSDYMNTICRHMQEIRAGKIITQVRAEGETITHKMKECRQRHLDRFMEGQIPPLSSMLFMDMLNAYRRIKDHLLNVAEAMDLTIDQAD